MAINVEAAPGSESLPPRDWRDEVLAEWMADGFIISEVLFKPERTTVGWSGLVGNKLDYLRMPGPWASPEDEAADQHYRETVEGHQREFGKPNVRTMGPTARMLHEHPEYTAGLHRVVMIRTTSLL